MNKTTYLHTRGEWVVPNRSDPDLTSPNKALKRAECDLSYKRLSSDPSQALY